jgi:hypothetical protein
MMIRLRRCHLRPSYWRRLYKSYRTHRMLTRLLRKNERWLAESAEHRRRNTVEWRELEARWHERDIRWRRLSARLGGQLELFPDPSAPPALPASAPRRRWWRRG